MSSAATEDWNVMEAPLREADETLVNFAEEHNLELEKNHLGWPNRRLKWMDAKTQKLIQIAVDDQSKLTFQVSYIAWRDREGKRYGKRLIVRRGVTRRQLSEGLADFLAEGHRTLAAWTERDLAYWSNLA